MHELKRLTYSAITNSISAIAYKFKVNFHEIGFLSSPIIAMAKRSCQLSGRIANLNREKHRRLPVTHDMIQWLKQYYWGVDIDRSMTYIAITLAYNFMLRSSEYIYSSSTSHAIRAEDLEFISNNNIRIKPWNIKSNLLFITSAVLVIRSSKSDNLGKGRYLHLGRNSALESDFLNNLIQWCGESGLNSQDPLFTRYKSGRRKLLTTQMVSIALKLMASTFGFDSAYFASHSLRIGGMTTMIASGVDRNKAKKIGGWSESSSCDQIYDRNTPNDKGTLSIKSLLNSSDIKRLVPIQKEQI
jgi:hypothetical protein